MHGRTIFTPRESDILLGVARKMVLKVAVEAGFVVEEKDITLTDLALYDAAFITSTSSKILPVRAIDDNTFDVQSAPLRELMGAFDRFLAGCQKDGGEILSKPDILGESTRPVYGSTPRPNVLLRSAMMPYTETITNIPTMPHFICSIPSARCAPSSRSRMNCTRPHTNMKKPAAKTTTISGLMMRFMNLFKSSVAGMRCYRRYARASTTPVENQWLL